MSLEQYHEKYSESKNLFQDQLILILHLRSVVIKPTNFPSGFTLESICERLELLMQSLEPKGYIEQLQLTDWNLVSIPVEAEFLFGPHLRLLSLHKNRLNALPTLVGACQNLESLDLSLNSIKAIRRKELYNLSSLKSLLLKDNKLSFLPPVLADLASLESIDYSGNPLIFPSVEFIESSSSSVRDLKSYLANNRHLIDQHIDSQLQLNLKQAGPTTPSFVRTRSISDARTKSLKASRRMGLFINNSKATPEGSSSTPNQSMDSITPSKPDRKLSFLSNEIATSQETGKEKDSHVTVDISRMLNTTKQPEVIGINKDFERNKASLSVEDHIFDQGDTIDLEPKLSTFSRRLSTLPERPIDEHSRNQLQEKRSDLTKTEEMRAGSYRSNGFDVSPSKATKIPGNGNQVNSLHWPQTYSTMVQVIRKFLFCSREVKACFSRLFPDNRIPGVLINVLLSFSRDYSFLQEIIDNQEAHEENMQLLLKAFGSTINSFKTSLLSCSEHARMVANQVDVCQLRTAYLSLFGILTELNNLHRLVTSTFNLPKVMQLNGKGSFMVSPSLVEQKSKGSQQIHSREHSSEGSGLDMISGDIDVRLLKAVENSTSDALVVLGELTDTINTQVLSNLKVSQPLPSALTLKCKDLNNACNSAGDITRRLIASLHSYRIQPTQQVRKSLWDEINSFLKVILQIFATVKGIMNDGPVLNDVRQSMANLTKSTKEVTILLEVSSLKSSNELTASSLGSNLMLLGVSSNPQVQLQGALSNVHLGNQQLLANVKASIRGQQIVNVNSTILTPQEIYRANVNTSGAFPTIQSTEGMVAIQSANVSPDT